MRGQGKGDLYAKAMIQVPRRMTARQKEIMEEFARLSGEKGSSANGDSLTDKLKKVFK